MNDSLKPLIRIGVILGAPILAALITYLILNRIFFMPANRNATETIRIEVAQGKSLREIADDLKEKGILRYSMSLRIISRLQKADTRITAGEYELSPSMTPREVLKKLSSGEVFKRKILIKEGMNVWEIADAVEQAGLITKQEFTTSVTDRGLLQKAGLPATAKSFEGYLFPETYFFSRPINGEKIIWTMLEEGEKHWPEQFSIQSDVLQMTRHDILTLASIIEKETGDADEMPIIASVFHNRLKQGMRLQSDPTVIYGMPNFNGNLTRADLETPSPYNTYSNFGLPPGPIGNPGEKAIRAALYPRDTAYLYFVANGKGSHIFSTNLKEHNEAVQMYQLGKAQLPPEPEPTPTTAPSPEAGDSATPQPQ